MKKDRILAIRIILLVLAIFCGCCIGYHIMYDYSNSMCKYEEKDITRIQGYEILDQQQFRMASIDPQLILDVPHLKLSTVTIRLQSDTEKDIPVTVYYRKGLNGYAEKNTLTGVILQGTGELTLDSDLLTCDELRLDIDGDFQYGYVAVAGEFASLNMSKLIGFVLIYVFALILFWIFLSGVLTCGIQKLLLFLAAQYNKGYDWIHSLFERKKLHIGHVFCVIVLFYGIAMACVIPADQIPDELTHYYQMVESAGFPKIEKQIEDYFYKTGAGDMQGNPLVKVDKARFSAHSNDHFDKTAVNFTKPSLSIVKHLPPAILFFIGYFLDLPVWVCLLMAEMGSLLFFMIMGYLTLKYMPIKKELMCGIMLLPMTVQQCASVNYDAVFIPLCLFYTAYVLHCKYEKEKVSWKSLFIFLVIPCIVLLIKPTYIPFFLIVFMIPLDKWDLRIGKLQVTDFIKRFKWLLLILGILLFAGFLYIGRNNVFIQLVEACVLRPGLTLKIIYDTVKEMYSFYFMSTIGHLGWLDILLPKAFYYFVLVCLFLFCFGIRENTNEVSYGFTWKERVFMILVVVITTCLIIIAMFSWTMFLYDIDTGGTLSGTIKGLQQISVSLGVQGRYFLPFLPLCFLPFDGLLKINQKKLLGVQCLYYPIVIACSLWAAFSRYWI